MRWMQRRLLFDNDCTLGVTKYLMIPLTADVAYADITFLVKSSSFSFVVSFMTRFVKRSRRGLSIASSQSSLSNGPQKLREKRGIKFFLRPMEESRDEILIQTFLNKDA